MITINVLDTKYKITERPLRADAHTDTETRTIYIADDLSDRRYREVLRREIIKIFMREYPPFGMIQWYAQYAPELQRVFHDAAIDY